VLALCDALRSVRGIVVTPAAFDPGDLSPHLSMRVAVIDNDGSTSAVGRDLRVLQRAVPPVAASMAATLRSTATAAWQRTGLTQWDVGALPDTVIVAQRPRDLVLYPALLDSDGRVDLTLLPPGPTAVARHRAGVRRLLLKALPQQMGLVRDRLGADRELVLAYHGVGTTAQLVDDLLCACAEQAFALDPPIRDAATFAARLQQGRAELVGAADELRALLSDALPLHRNLRRALAGAKNAPADVRDAIAGQLDALVGPRFLTETPREWRKHVPRYLKAAEQRWQKRGHAREREAAAEFDTAAARLAHWRASWPDEWPWPAVIIEYRWLLEEFRVSLFAQAFGTSRPVSAKRLDQVWQRALAALGEQSARA
jgi:ATP-dependent helicase HrpA